MVSRMLTVYVPDNIDIEEMIRRVSEKLAEHGLKNSSRNRVLLAMILAGYTCITGDKVVVRIGRRGEEVSVEPRRCGAGDQAAGAEAT